MATSEDFRVDCTCPEKLEKIETRIGDALNSVDRREPQTRLIEDQRRQQQTQNFKQNLHKVLSNNVRFVNESAPQSTSATGAGSRSDQQSTASVLAPTLNDRFNYCLTELLPEIEATTKTISRKRKAYPEECCRLVRARLETRLSEAVASVEKSTPGASTSIMDTGIQGVVNEEELLDLAKSININSIRFKQGSVKLRTTMDSLSIAEDQYRRDKLSVIDPLANSKQH